MLWVKRVYEWWSGQPVAVHGAWKLMSGLLSAGTAVARWYLLHFGQCYMWLIDTTGGYGDGA
jgi:hypothetical protein